MTAELLATILLATCPLPDKVETNTCHEYLLNCAVGKVGEIETKVVEACITKWRNEK